MGFAVLAFCSSVAVSSAGLAKFSDFDGDGKADLTVYHPAKGEWFSKLSFFTNTGKYGRWSGHTHPTGHSLSPGPADQPFLRAMKQKQSGIWGDDGASYFDRGFPWNIDD